MKNPAFSLSFFTFIKRLFSSSSLSVIGMVSSAWQCGAVLSDFLQGPCSHSNFLPVFYGSLGSDRRRQWHPTRILLPGKSHERRNLVSCSPWGHWELDTTKWLHFHFSFSCTGEGNGNPLQCSYLENPRDRGAWWAALYGVTQIWTRLKRLSSSSSSRFRSCAHGSSEILSLRLCWLVPFFEI